MEEISISRRPRTTIISTSSGLLSHSGASSSSSSLLMMTSMGFAERKVKPLRTGLDASSGILRRGRPVSRCSQQDLRRENSSPSGFLPLFLSSSILSILFSATTKSLRIISSSSCQKSCSGAAGEPPEPSKFLTTCKSASHGRTWFQTPPSDFEDEVGISEGRRYSIFV